MSTGALAGLRVIEAADGIAGGYAGKLLVDQGAHVVKVEGPGGDPLRRWSAGHPDTPNDGTGPLFSFLAAGKASCLPGSVEAGWADVVLAGEEADDLLGAQWRDRCGPDVTIVSISPFGSDGPLAGVPATEFTLQAWCGVTSACGSKEQPMYMGVGGGQWATGATAALAALAGQRVGGARAEVAALEVMAVCLNNYPGLYRRFTGKVAALSRGGDWPSVVRCKDGWVGLCIFTAQQWSDFAAMIERPELSDDTRLSSMGARSRNRELAESVIRPWLDTHTEAEIFELASLFRVPAAAIGNGQAVLDMPQLVERGVFVDNPAGFVQPRPPLRMSAVPATPVRPAPALGTGRGDVRDPDAVTEDTVPGAGTVAAHPGSAVGGARRPLDGIRILDLTAFWAGPYATHLLATLGADVIKVESPRRPDGMRLATVADPSDEHWLEFGPTFHGTNPAKRSVTIDFSTASGRDLLLRLVGQVDAVIENFTPRVLDGAGIDYPTLQEANPSVIFLRMPGFGLDGPLANSPGFAQTMEQTSGIGWLTGRRDGEPMVRSTMDPICGIHGAFALLAALAYRERTGEGQLVEVPMVEVALNVAAESIVTYSAEGVLLSRDTNRGPRAVPQGVYRCAGTDRWVAVGIEAEAQWAALAELVGRPEWRSFDRAQRRARHDEIDAVLAAWLAPQDREAAATALLAAGVPAAPVWDQNDQDALPQLVARRFTQHLEHPVAGDVPTPGIGIRSDELDLAYRAPAPMYGEHTVEVLTGLLGLSPDELQQLSATGAIGHVS